ncbi:hypothetical protein Sjap_026069 [Stephania japonica]|uniref:DUF8039 domain-containing protein n=1 Tax=Stephania japonica TaxID=461633 RepID=A0AAP0EAP3_9MAGN
MFCLHILNFLVQTQQVVDGSSCVLHRKCKLLKFDSISDKAVAVAEGSIACVDPTEIVHHIPLGIGNWKIWIERVIDSTTLLYRPDIESDYMARREGTNVVWPKKYVILI